MQPDLLHMRITVWLMIVTLCAVIFFAVFPFVDLYVAQFFFKNGHGAWIGVEKPFPMWRNILRHATGTIVVITFLVFVGNLMLASEQKTGWRVWAFLWSPMFLCAGILVNMTLKTHLGRARPNGVMEFGGSQTFTPPFQWSDQCVSNCSFSSGEAAMMACFVLPLCVLIWPQLSRLRKIICASTASFLIVNMGLLRMAAGRHFLSDVVMSVLFAALTTLFLYRLLGIGQHREVFTLSAVCHDCHRLLRDAFVWGRKATVRGRKAVAVARNFIANDNGRRSTENRVSTSNSGGTV
ncbi:phosphatase PAP2 family protein [Agrobacterium sp. BA1120]|uniref:phosphatase PAP2 family protein n=1 Tax=Agrobacterium sp. BA1120 TaxID=3228927 RepID=UPI00336A3782